MKTDRLIDLLSSHVEPVRSPAFGLVLTLAIAAGAAAAFCLMLGTLGLRPDLGAPAAWPFLCVKLLFALALVGVGTAILARAVRPGRDLPRLWAIGLPLAALGIAAAVALSLGHPAVPMTPAGHWGMCLTCIPLFGALPFIALIWAARRGAPTQLRRTGATIGLVAGGLAAAAYAFYCPDDSVTFVILSYALAVAFCVVAGAVLGPRLLRW